MGQLRHTCYEENMINASQSCTSLQTHMNPLPTGNSTLEEAPPRRANGVSLIIIRLIRRGRCAPSTCSRRGPRGHMRLVKIHDICFDSEHVL